MQHKVDIQRTSAMQPAGYDVFVDGDHYLSYHTHAEALTGAREAAGETNGDVLIRDYTRPFAGKRFTIIEN